MATCRVLERDDDGKLILVPKATRVPQPSLPRGSARAMPRATMTSCASARHRRVPARRSRSLAGAWPAILLLGAGAQSQALGASFADTAIDSSEGYFQIRWQADEPVRLVESASSAFAPARTVYAGSDTAHVVSGKPDGVWFYRLESSSGNRVLSDTLAVTVRHHSLGRAFFFFALGALVFAATLGLIVISRRGADERG